MEISMDQEQHTEHLPRPQAHFFWKGWTEIEKFQYLVSEQKLIPNEFSVGKWAAVSPLHNIIDVVAS